MPDENEKSFRQSLAFNAEACRAGMFSAALDMARMMSENEVPNGEAALLTGFTEAAAQLWMQVMLKAGKTRQEARQAFEKQARTFAIKHSRPEDQKQAVAS